MEEKNDKEFLKMAVEKAKGSVEKGGFPAGAVLVKDGEIVAEGISIGFELADPTSHAETACVRQACKKLKTIDLSGSVLYASLQPCVMCYCSSNWARVERIVYGCRKTKEMAEKQYYEGYHDLQSLNETSIHQIKFTYISDFEEEMLELIEQWETKRGEV